MYQIVYYTTKGTVKLQFEHLFDAIQKAAHQATRAPRIWLELKADAFAHQDLILAEFRSGDHDETPIKCRQRPDLLEAFISSHVEKYLDWSEDTSLPIEERLQHAQSAARLPARIAQIMKDLSTHLSAIHKWR